MIINIALPGRGMTRHKKREILAYLDYHGSYSAGSGIFRRNKMFRIYKEGVEITVFEETDSFREDWIDECQSFLKAMFPNELIGITCSKKDVCFEDLDGVKAIQF